jgi:hypothetical protein
MDNLLKQTKELTARLSALRDNEACERKRIQEEKDNAEKKRYQTTANDLMRDFLYHYEKYCDTLTEPLDRRWLHYRNLPNHPTILHIDSKVSRVCMGLSKISLSISISLYSIFCANPVLCYAVLA